jgi:hypothetical protein
MPLVNIETMVQLPQSVRLDMASLLVIDICFTIPGRVCLSTVARD